MIKITALIEETCENEGFVCEHGLSLYIETPRHRLLFDAGQTGRFALNADKLGIDLNGVDIAVLSHAHYDHANGFPEFLRRNDHARIYADRRIFESYFAADGRYVGVCPELVGSPRLVLTEDELVIDDELTIFTGNGLPRRHPMSSFGMLKEQCGALCEDDFLHEHYLKIDDGEGYVLITGCSHKGILNILDWCAPPPRALAGGFHFMKIPLDDEGKGFLGSVAARLNALPTQFYTCHCTGEEQYRYLSGLMPRLYRLRTAQSVTL